MKNRKGNGTRVVCWCLFAMYLAALLYFLFFAESTGRTFTERTYQYNLRPLHEIRRFIVYRRQLGFAAVTLNLVGNVAAFVPFGLFLPLLLRDLRYFWKTVLLGFEFSLLVEIVQLFGKVGSFDVDDILLNTLGAALGYAAFRVLTALRKSGRARREQAEKRPDAGEGTDEKEGEKR